MTMNAGSTPPDPVERVGRLAKANRFHVGDATQNLREARERRLLVVDDGDVHCPSPPFGGPRRKPGWLEKHPSK